MQALATEIINVKNIIGPEIMNEVFAPKVSPYYFHNNNSFQKKRVNSLWYT